MGLNSTPRVSWSCKLISVVQICAHPAEQLEKHRHLPFDSEIYERSLIPPLFENPNNTMPHQAAVPALPTFSERVQTQRYGPTNTTTDITVLLIWARKDDSDSKELHQIHPPWYPFTFLHVQDSLLWAVLFKWPFQSAPGIALLALNLPALISGRFHTVHK